VVPVIGNLLLVTVAVIIGVTLAVLGITFLDGLGAPTAEGTFEYEQTPVGLEITPEVLGTDVSVKLNGEQVTTIESGSAGESVLVPTAPNDRLTIVSRDGEKSVFLEEEIDERSEVGDFISYYTFQEGNDDTELADESGNDNDGDLKDDRAGSRPTWAGCGLRFDGSGDYVNVPDITTAGTNNVEEFTIAVTYEQTGNAGDVNQLVEHQFGGGEEWFIETSPASITESYSNGYSVDYAVEYSDHVASSTAVSQNTRHTVVGTYDGSDYSLYVDGQQVDSGSHSQAVGMGDMRIGRDYEDESQYLNGEICEMRLYYAAFDSSEVELITNAMD
jgi:hypothetical protein